jgi:hypothetical protein
MNKKESVVVNCCKNGWHCWASTKKKELKKRQLKLDENYVFNSVNIEKLRILNAFLYAKQLEIKKRNDAAIKVNNELKNINEFERFECFVFVELFSRKWYFETYEIQFQENSFYNNVTLSKQRHAFKNGNIDLDNWNEFSKIKNHPLQKEKYCYLLKHIRCCGYLAWEDILKINEIWFQVIIQSEFSRKLK